VAGAVGTIVRKRNREGDRVANVGSRVVDALLHRQISLLRRLRGAAAVVTRIGVKLIGTAHERRVGLRIRAYHPGAEQQRGTGGVIDGPYHPNAGGAVVTSLAGAT